MTQEVTLAILAHGDDEAMIGYALRDAEKLVGVIATDGEATTLDYDPSSLCTSRC